MLVGRDDETEALDQQLARVRVGHSTVLVVRGEAGVGKTVLLEYVAERASASTWHSSVTNSNTTPPTRVTSSPRPAWATDFAPDPPAEAGSGGARRPAASGESTLLHKVIEPGHPRAGSPLTEARGRVRSFGALTC